MLKDWEIDDYDRELFARELNSFVPPHIFDAHAHWYCVDHIPSNSVPPLLQAGPPIAGSKAFDLAMEQLIPYRRIEGLFFPYPHPELDVESANEFIYQERLQRRSSRGQMLVTPSHDSEFVRETVRRCGFVGLKCYHIYAPCSPTFNSRIEDFLTESHVKIAHEEELSITLHIVRSRALADEANLHTIRRYCEQYPNIRLILAHAARGFNPHHTIAGIDSLKGLKNVWFDSSAITDCGAIEAILRVLGHRRVLYGSDFPVSQLRGRCVALGDSFLWISADNTQLEVPYGDLQLALIGHEALRALKVAALSFRLSDSQVEDIFYQNGAELWG